MGVVGQGVGVVVGQGVGVVEQGVAVVVGQGSGEGKHHDIAAIMFP